MWTILRILRDEECKKLFETARNAGGSDSAEHQDALIEINSNLLIDIKHTPIMLKS